MAAPLLRLLRREGHRRGPGLALLHHGAARAGRDAAGEEEIKGFVLLLGLLIASPVLADEKLWAALQGGGHVVLIRHALTTPGTGDPPGFKLDDCATQRNLSDEGRRHARSIGKQFLARKIPVERVLSSPWCRCLETARLAFGKVDEVSPALGNLFGRPENRDKQMVALGKITAVKPKGNLVLVTHGSTVLPLAGVHPATGELVVLSQGKLVGRLSVD